MYLESDIIQLNVNNKTFFHSPGCPKKMFANLSEAQDLGELALLTLNQTTLQPPYQCYFIFS